jgi:hypothetical protein
MEKRRSEKLKAIKITEKIIHLKDLVKYIEWTYDHADLMNKQYREGFCYDAELLIRVLKTTKLQTEKEIFELKKALEETDVYL